MKELWDAYDRSFNRIEGLVIERGQVIPEGVFHLVCDVAVRHTDGTYLLMQRAYSKHLGGMWELSAGGSALQGEEAYDCAVRELWEETGVKAVEMIEIGRSVNDDNHSLYVEFLAITDCPKDAVRMNEGETIGFRWVSETELSAMREELASKRTVDLILRQ